MNITNENILMKQRLLISLMSLSLAAGSWAQGPNDSGEYYKAADGKKGAALKTALCGIVYNRDEEGATVDTLSGDRRACRRQGVGYVFGHLKLHFRH